MTKSQNNDKKLTKSKNYDYLYLKSEIYDILHQHCHQQCQNCDKKSNYDCQNYDIQSKNYDLK